MTEIPIWPGSSSFTTGSTPFGYFESESLFRVDADKVSNWCAKRLGYPLVDVELQSANFYACFEEAVAEYSNHVNQYNIQQNMLSIMGSKTDSNLTHRNISTGMGPLIQLATEYGSETFTNGNVTFHTASIAIKTDQQKYNLNKLIRDVAFPTGSIEIKRVHHYAPPASMRFYDPYLGNQAMLDTFGFGAYSTGVSFTLMPMYADLLRVQAIEFNDMIRKSAYSFEITGDRIRIFPLPTYDYTMYINYVTVEDKANLAFNANSNSVGDFSNAPYELHTYSYINPAGRQWIFKYTLALAKEVLGNIRSKYSTVPIPGSEVTLNGADLVSQAQTEKDALITQLRENLDAVSRQAQLAKMTEEADNIQSQLTKVPMPIYIG